MSTLSDKILSYSPEVYYRFNQAYTGIPTNLGSVGGNPSWSSTGENPIYLTDGGVHGEGSWQFGFGRGISDTSTTAFGYTGTGTINAPYQDSDYSIGYWFKTDFTLNDASAHATSWTCANFGGVSSLRNIIVAVNGGAINSSSKGKLAFRTIGSNKTVTTSTRVDDQQWHYIAMVTKTVVSTITDVYLDGVYVDSFTQGSTTGGTSYTRFGNSSQSTISPSTDWTYFQISDYYHTPTSVIDATEIAEIWAAGSSVGPTNNLTYWDGTQWAVPTNKYQWDGTNWVTFNGKYWNGSAWIDIT